MKTGRNRNPSHQSAPRAKASQTISKWMTAGILAVLVLTAIVGIQMFQPPPLAAEPTSVSVVKNTGKGNSANAALNTSNPAYAQRFTATATAADYTLQTIAIQFSNIADVSSVSDELTVTLNEESSSDPGTALCTLTNPDTFTGSGLQLFTAPSACPNLEKGNTYFVVATRANDNTDAIELVLTTFGEDSGNATGWSIGDKAHKYVEFTSDWSLAPTNLKIDVKGSVPNNSATGVPAITGTPHVEEILTADTSAIEDDDGITNQNFAYRWLRVDGMTETTITGANGSTYTLTDEDAAKTIKVKVAFDDDLGNAEGPLSSEPTDTITTDVLVRNTNQSHASTNNNISSAFPKLSQTHRHRPRGLHRDSIGFLFHEIADTATAASSRRTCTTSATPCSRTAYLHRSGHRNGRMATTSTATSTRANLQDPTAGRRQAFTTGREHDTGYTKEPSQTHHRVSFPFNTEIARYVATAASELTVNLIRRKQQ